MEILSFLELSSYAGLLATCFLTLNILLGMMLSTGYSNKQYWKQVPAIFKKWDLTDVHNVTAYISLVLVILHPLLLLLDPTAEFTLIDMLFPVNAPKEKLMVALGTISMYALIIVVITTQKVVKRSLGFRTWKVIHLISYGTALLFLIHGMIIDPKLKNRPVDLIDAEKIISEGCLLLIIVATGLRYNYYVRKRNKKMVGLQKVS